MINKILGMLFKRKKPMDYIGNISSIDIERKYSNPALKQSDIKYPDINFSENQEYYRDVINKFGFCNQDKVIDVGGGYARWGLFLAECNKHVTVLDIHPYLLDIGQRLADACGLKNMDFREGSAEELPYADAAYDAVWTHSFIFLVDRHKTLSELSRVVKPGGYIFFGSFNGPGKMLRKACEGFQKGGLQHPRCIQGLSGLRKTPLDPSPPNYLTTQVLDKVLAEYGLAVDRNFPLDTGRRTSEVGEKYSYLFDDTHALADKFESDSEFREMVVANARDISRSVDFDLWFRAKKL